MPPESTKKTIMVALGVCLVCSILVSSAAVSLNGIQSRNKTLDKITNILLAGDLYSPDEDVEKIYADKIKPLIIEIATGKVLPEAKYTEKLNEKNFEIKNIANDPAYSVAIPTQKDIAGIKRKPKYMLIYEIVEKGEVIKYIFPIYGKGLWSTLYGFIALDSDLNTVKGFTFYEHGETPGLGGEVDNPKWKAIWNGKKVFDEYGSLKIEVIKGPVDNSSLNAKYQIDGLSGSTITTRGVDKLVKFWLGEEGYGPFIEKVNSGGPNEKV